jgi:hypothetical protein
MYQNPANTEVQQSATSKSYISLSPEIDGGVHYTRYLDPALPLAERLHAAFNELQIAPDERRGILDMLGPLNAKHPPTCGHCIRVGLVARKIGEFLQHDDSGRALFYAGLLHDVGKASADLALLEKTSGWTEADSKAMSRHVVDGHRLLQGRFDFSADILKFHHKFQPNGYPAVVPKALHDYSFATFSKLTEYGRILAIADVYDALHRVNDRHGETRGLSGIEIKEQMLKFNPDKTELIDRLYKSEVLTTFILGEPHAETIELDEADTLHEGAFQFTDIERSHRNTQRHVQIAAALEVLSNKAGCTTRLSDVSRHLKASYFVLSAINIGEAFGRMAEEISNSCTKPEVLYRYAYQAQVESKRNRRGGRVNQGMIELLLPIVAAQHLHDNSYSMGTDEILALAADFLCQTGRADVEQLSAMKRHAFELCHYDREVPNYAGARSVASFYEQELLLNSESATSVAHNSEFLRGFPTVKLMTDVMLNSPYPHFNQRVEEAFHQARAIHDPEVAAGFLADCIAAAIYLSLSQNPRRRIFG